MNRQNVTLTAEDLNELARAANGILANLTIIENIAKGHTAEYSEPGSKASMTLANSPDKPVVAPKAPIYCSSCGKKVNPDNPLAGSITSPLKIPGLRNVAEKGYRYVFEGLDCYAAISGMIMQAVSNDDKPRRPYQQGPISSSSFGFDKNLTTYLVKRYASDHDFRNNLSTDMSAHTIVSVVVNGTYFYVVYS
jgi:hypothetical protein